MRMAMLLVAATIALVACNGPENGETPAPSSSFTSTFTSTPITVYKTPTCGCCGKWIEHLEEAGFSVESIDVQSTANVRASNGVPADLGSYHTAVVDGYVVEGHVPAQDVARLLAERPNVVGIAVPGMPIGSPGMEGPNPERYSVLAWNEQGGREIFATHGP
jgi:hypothetical protein